MTDKKLQTYKYPGAIHIHTINSDGTGNIETITKAAKKNGLHWIIITDHNNFDVKEGIINGVYVIKGEEISPGKKDHYLALGISDLIQPFDDCSDNIKAVRDNGGFGIAAHPDESLDRKNICKPIRWTDKNNTPDGIEIWNWFSQWADNFNSRNIFGLIYSYLFRTKLVKKPPKETLEWWDELNNNSQNIIPATGGIDAHALRIYRYIIPVTIFPYKFMLKTIVNEIFLDSPLDDDYEKAKRQILNAIKNGNNIIANKTVCENIPQIYITNTNTVKQSGENIKFDLNTYFHVECNKESKIIIFRNGIKIKESYSKDLILKLEQTGKYRAEVEINDNGFAYSNPINVL